MHLLIACFLSNISAKYYANPTLLLRVIAKNFGAVFLDTVYISYLLVAQISFHLSVVISVLTKFNVL